MARSKASEKKNDFFDNAPDIVMDKILEKLPIRMAAQASVLSTQWRRAWLSLTYLNFKLQFQDQRKSMNGKCKWRKISQIISSILLHHNGPVREFCLDIPINVNLDHVTLSRWISFLSNNRIQTITIDNYYNTTYIPSYIFRCIELVKLNLIDVSINSLPTGFLGFPKLKHLALEGIRFSNPNTFCSLMKNCTMLVTLELEDLIGVYHISIDNVPSLETLKLKGEWFKSLAALKNVCRLRSFTICLETMPEQPVPVETIDAINLLATSDRLQEIMFDGHLCKFLVVGGNDIKSSSVMFNHLDKLCLKDLDLSDFDVFSYLLSMIECCPYIKKLDISVVSGCKSVGKHKHKLEFNHSYKLNHLRELNIKGITGSRSELKLVKYLLAISPVLDNLFFKPRKGDTDPDMEMLKALLKFPRASTKASLIFLEKKA